MHIMDTLVKINKKRFVFIIVDLIDCRQTNWDSSLVGV